ncbi:MFS transporter [Paraburkholderia sp. DHOC27]|uniref:MFS transporter n=1 Tax=Paraburkholderia sp. DHOC27 TaxID=2303330 RepID=UPI000E3C3BCF|nr:MFS transporter [Paraburkholderia sp. DHOC27]RFU49302.1 MFS transporter [Paraburkholderia sp. DHOC27]
MPLALLALTIGAFAIGTTEFVIVGLVPTIAQSLHVGLPSAGMLVSFYALGVAIGAPVLTAITGRVPRKILLVSLMALFTLANLLAWRAPGYETLVVARVLSGFAHGVFFSVGSVIATRLVPKEKAASAIATMFSGLTVAFVTGVPLGTIVGQHFGWRTTFLVVAAFGLVALIGALAFVPRNIEQAPPTSMRRQAELFSKPRLLLVFAITAIGYGGSLVAFTYLAPILEQVAGFSPAVVGAVLLVYGASVAVGNFFGGRLADRHGAVTALKIIFSILAGVLLLLDLTAHSKLFVLFTVLAWGAVAFGNVPALQVYVVKQAERFAPHAVGVASGMNIAAFNLGVAGGASAGGLIVTHMGLLDTPWIGAVAVLAALGLTILSGRLDARAEATERADKAALVAGCCG